MNSLVDVEILRVFLGETAQRDGKPVYELIVGEARGRGLAGATVTRGFMGFGASSLLHTSKILRLSEDLPVLVTIVDVAERIRAFLPVVDALVEEGTVTVEKAQAIFHLPMRIRDVMSGDVATAGPDTPISAVVELLIRREVKSLPIVDGGRIKGVITGGDLMSRANMPLRLDVQCQLPRELRAEHVRCLDLEGLTAKDVMTSPAQTVNIKTNVPDALRLMAKRKLKRLLAVDDSGNLMGVVSRVDVLRAIARAASVTAALPELPAGIKRTAGEVMFRDVPTASPDESLDSVLEKIVATPLRRVVVVDAQGKVAGLVLDRDLVSQYVRREKPGLLRSLLAALSPKQSAHEAFEGTAGGVMQTEVFRVLPQTPLTEVIHLLLEKRVKRLVVADADGSLRGMVDRDTVMRVLAGD
ncbi:MAG: DUF190 domain-containing protein [Desulfovibrionaceae bacterium]|nr:DUF190 domain-containing protein [Desulfovibrionaceae bacterium]MBF0515306.1 DUF190 domain-containing protein [Desulfovibrionaceae bacterium]